MPITPNAPEISYNFFDIFLNYSFVCAAAGWFVAQALKIVMHLMKYHEFIPKQFFASGGMPSSHSACATAMTTACAVQYGFLSPMFSMALIFSMIVMYDAAGVRRAAGEHAHIINQIVQDLQSGDTKYLSKNLKELIGHTPLQVLAGAALGILVALLLLIPFRNGGLV